MAKMLHFECSKCGEILSTDVPRNVCPKDGGPLYVRYDLAAIRKRTSRESVKNGPTSMWRYAAVLPDVEPVTLGEGMTPILPSRKYPKLLIKDDGTARGFTQILLTYTLTTISALLGLSTLWLACGTLARDIEEAQMQVDRISKEVLTNPVIEEYRFEIVD